MYCTWFSFFYSRAQLQCNWPRDCLQITHVYKPQSRPTSVKSSLVRLTRVHHLQRAKLSVGGEGQLEGEVDLARQFVEKVDAVAGAAVEIRAFPRRVVPGTQHTPSAQTLGFALDTLRRHERLLLDGQHLCGGGRCGVTQSLGNFTTNYGVL